MNDDPAGRNPPKDGPPEDENDPSGGEELTPTATLLFRFPRGTLEFDRVAFFSDAVFAIAMTLLIVGVGLPVLRSADVESSGAMWSAVWNKSDELVSFAVGFLVIGQYWIAHHRQFAWMGAADSTFIGVNLPYLGLVAFVPFPTGLIGRYEGNLVAYVIFIGTLALVSATEAALFRVAYRHDLLRVSITPAYYRWTQLGSLSPLLVFGVSILIAAFVSTTWGLISLLLAAPLGSLLNRARPNDTPEPRSIVV